MNNFSEVKDRIPQRCPSNRLCSFWDNKKICDCDKKRKEGLQKSKYSPQTKKQNILFNKKMCTI